MAECLTLNDYTVYMVIRFIGHKSNILTHHSECVTTDLMSLQLFIIYIFLLLFCI